MLSPIRNSRSNKPKTRATGILTLALTVGLFCTLPQAANADLLSETHEFLVFHDNPEWGQTYSANLDVPMFDTMGGSRQLAGLTIDYFYPMLDHTISVAANNTADYVTCEVAWDTTFVAYGPSGSPWIPMPPWGPYEMNLGQAFSGFNGPFGPADGPFEMVHSVDYPNSSQVIDDYSLFSPFIGTGTLPMATEMTLSELTASPDPSHAPPGSVFDPDLLSVTADQLHAGFYLTYHYTPEPTTLGILVVGATALLRRRR